MGAKAIALLMAALMFVDVPGYSAIIFRRSYTDLSKSGALIARSFEWLSGSKARWDAVNHTWNFPSGAKLHLASWRMTLMFIIIKVLSTILLGLMN